MSYLFTVNTIPQIQNATVIDIKPCKYQSSYVLISLWHCKYYPCIIMEYCRKFMEYCNLFWSTVVNLCGAVFSHSLKSPFYKGLSHPSSP